MNLNDIRTRIDMGKQGILCEYNYAVDCYNEVFNYEGQAGLDDECIKKLVGVGERLYEIYEKSMKYVAFKFYSEKVLDGNMSLTDFENNVSKPLDRGNGTSVFGTSVNIKTLSIWMAKYANPQLQVYDSGNIINSCLPDTPKKISKTEIDTEILRKYAGIAHNDNKHKFYYVANQQLMSICTQIFPYIENIIKRYIATDESLVKRYGIKINSGIHQIDKHFNSWNNHPYYKYVLVVDRTELAEREKEILMSLPWAMVIDFDTHSYRDGMLRAYVNYNKRTPIMLTPSAILTYDFSVIDTCWLFPNGREEEPQYMVQNDFQWRRAARSLENLIKQYHAKVGSLLKILVLDKTNAKKTGEMLLDIFDEYQADYQGKKVDIVSLVNDISHEAHKLVTAEGESVYSYYDVDMADLVNYIDLNITSKIQSNSDARKVPVRGNLRDVDVSSYSTFTVLDSGIAMRESKFSDKIDKMKFYLGETKISWYGIQHQFPIEWTEYYGILHNHEEALGKVKSPLKVILHEPGAGGTTFLRMYAYERSKMQPTIILDQYSLTQVADEIFKFYLACGKTPICICADSGELTYDQCQELKDAIDALSLAHDFVYAHRIGIPCETICTITELKSDTLRAMREHLCTIIDTMDDEGIMRSKEQRKYDIEYIANSSDRRYERMPLIMSLYAFDDRYMGTKEYIHNFLVGLNEMQKRQILYAAVIDKYSGMMVDINFFSENHEKVNQYGNQLYYLLEGAEGEQASENLFLFEENCKGIFCKIKHLQFSEKIIDELLPDRRNKITYYQRLVDCLCDLIAFCARAETHHSEKLTELVSTMFITKSQEVLAETAKKRFFGPVVDTLYNEIEDSVLKVTLLGKIFKKLTEVYPENPHFEAHYGRYYGIIAKEHDKSISHAQKAVNMMEKADEILYHILATSIRQYIKALINGDYKKALPDEKKQIENKILQLGREASNYYELSRENQSYAGYISDIEMCIMMIDFAAQGNYSQIINNEKSNFYEYYERVLALKRVIDSDEVMLTSNGNIEDKLSSLNDRITPLLLNLQDTVVYWEKQIKIERNQERLFIHRGMLVEAMMYGNEKYMTNDRIEQCIIYMEKNIDYKYRYADLNCWFEFITLVHKENDYEFLVDKDVKIREWIEKNPNTLELYYYLFIIDSILALGNNSRYCSDMRNISKKLNSMTYLYRGNTIPRRVLTGKGNRLQDVVKFAKGEIEERATVLEGIVDSGNLQSANPYIYCNGISVYFNVDRQHLYRKNRPGEKVNFKMLYTLQGAMALENTVVCTDGVKRDVKKQQTEQMSGKKYSCKCVGRGRSGSIIVEIEDMNNEKGIIYISDFPKGEAMKNGDIKNLIIRDNSKVKHDGKKYWRMCIENRKGK